MQFFTNLNLSNWYKIISTLLCMSGLIYQCTQLLSQYISRQSVVNIEIKREINANLPAITICYPYLISFERITKYYPKETQEEYKKYKNLFEYMRINRTLIKTYQDEMIKIYTDIVENVYSNNDFIQADTIMHIFENLSLTLVHELSKKSIIIDIKAHMDVELTNSSELKKDNLMYQYIGHPIESIDPSRMKKCFTYFSHIKKEWRKIAIDLDYIDIVVNMQTEWFPLSMLDKFHIAIHSAKTIPELKMMNFIEIKPFSNNLITFNKVSSIKYEDCNEYGQNEFPSIRSDCLTLCMLTIMNKTLGIDKYSDELLRKQVIKRIGDIRFKTGGKGSMKFNKNKLYRGCERQCQPDCQDYHYLYDIILLGYNPYNVKLGFNSVFDIRLQHNRLPDVLVRHMPEMTFIAFVSNFGGLLGMWLGMSALIIFDNILSFTKRIIKAISRNDDSSRVFIIQNNLATMNVNNNTNTNVNINYT